MQAAKSLASRVQPSSTFRPAPRRLLAHRPSIMVKPTLQPQRGKGIHRSPAITTQALPSGAAGPAPEPFRDDGSADDAQQPLAKAAPTSTTKQACDSEDLNWGYTWLNHPNPYNPFRTRVDENGMYVPPNMQQRQRALEMGLPLYGAKGK